MLTEKVKAVECASLVLMSPARQGLEKKATRFFKKISQAISVGTLVEFLL